MLCDRPHGFAGTCIDKVHLFAAATSERLLTDFRQALARLVTQPEQTLAAFHSLQEELDRDGQTE